MDKELWIVLGVFVFAVTVWMLHWYLTRNKGKMTGHATVVSKTPEAGQYGAKWASSWNYKIVFRVGQYEFPLYVLRSEYETIQVGMTGRLTWQEENMLEFAPEEQEV